MGRKRQVATEAVLRARLLGLLFAGGATVSLVALALPQPHGVNRALSVWLAAAGYPVALLAATRGARWRPIVLELTLAAGTAAVTGGIAAAHGSGVGVAAAFYYLWVVLYSAHFFPGRAVAVQVALIAASYGAVQVAVGRTGAGAEWVLVMGAVVVTAVVMAAVTRRLRQEASHDDLTGLPNRSVLDTVLRAEIERARRFDLPLGVAVLDLDGFKQINDGEGHDTGDRVLAATALAWRQQLRAVDALVRLGGDEFVAILPGCDLDHAERILSRLEQSGPVAASFGLAALQHGDDPASFLRRADQALLAAKAARRDEV
jgi:diguanylate cyclase (GGDEF)-like protein